MQTGQRQNLVWIAKCLVVYYWLTDRQASRYKQVQAGRQVGRQVGFTETPRTQWVSTRNNTESPK